MNNGFGGPQIYGGLQRGRILKREFIQLLSANKPYDIDLSDVDCSTNLALDVVFTCNGTPTSGALYLYRKSMIMRSTGVDPVKFSPVSLVSSADIALAVLFGLNPGTTVSIPTGLESFGLCTNLNDGNNGVTVTDVVIVLRIVDQPITVIEKVK